GLPMPSRLADDREMRALVEAMGDSGHGVTMLTKGAHTTIAFLESLAADSRRPVMIAALLHNSTNPQVVFDELEAISVANARSHLRLVNGEWSKVQVVETASNANSVYEQRSIGDIATAQQRDPLDVMLDLALNEDLKTVFTALLLNSDEAAVAKMLNHPHSLV